MSAMLLRRLKENAAKGDSFSGDVANEMERLDTTVTELRKASNAADEPEGDVCVWRHNEFGEWFCGCGKRVRMMAMPPHTVGWIGCPLCARKIQEGQSSDQLFGSNNAD